jgi:hypothetical protein
MDIDELSKRLFEMTVDDLNQLIPFEDDVSTGIMKLDLAAKTRQVVHAVQLEDMWQAFNDTAQQFTIYLSLKLSPMTLCSVLNTDQELNGLEWQLVIPRLDSIQEDYRPSCFGEYLREATQVDISDIEDYDIEEACQFLDKAYDFSWMRDRPGSSYRPQL